MRRVLLATVATIIVMAPLASAVKAEDTTVIKKEGDVDHSTTVIKKRDDVNMFPIPHREEKKTIIKKEDE